MLTLFKPQDRDLHAFQPILAEIEDRPPSPLGPVMFWLVVAIVAFAVLWTCFAQVDVVIAAPGKIAPLGHIKVVQPLETGVIRELRVKEGDFVRKGQVLVVLDPSTVEPALDALTQARDLANLEAQRLASQLTGRRFAPGGGELATNVASAQQQLAQASRAALSEQLASRQAMVAQLTQQAASAKTDEASAQKLIQMERQRMSRLAPVRDLLPRRDVEQVEQSLVEQQNRLEEARHRQRELAERRIQLGDEMGALRQTYQRDLLDQLAQVQKRAIDLDAQLRQVAYRRQKSVLVAPDDGYIEQVGVTTIGGVVQAGQTLLSIVPANVPLMVEAVVQNRDIGYLSEGLPAAVKVETYDFQKYGTVPGKLLRLSNDSRQEEGQLPVFKATVALEQTTLKVQGRDARLRPGMTVMADLKVGRRRVIEFVLYPILRSLSESVAIR